MPHLAVTGIVQLDVVETHFIAREMYDLGRDRSEIVEPEPRQIPAQVVGAPGNVPARIFGTIGVSRIVGFADVARIVKQRRDESHDRALRADAIGWCADLLESRQQASHRERHVERVLHVVIHGVAALVSADPACEQLREIVKCEPDEVERRPRIRRAEDVAHSVAHFIDRTDPDGIRDVELTAPVLRRPACAGQIPEIGLDLAGRRCDWDGGAHQFTGTAVTGPNSLTRGRAFSNPDSRRSLQKQVRNQLAERRPDRCVIRRSFETAWLHVDTGRCAGVRKCL